jgi:hypothetical protein
MSHDALYGRGTQALTIGSAYAFARAGGSSRLIHADHRWISFRETSARV